jgi:hypothetical protein
MASVKRDIQTATNVILAILREQQYSSQTIKWSDPIQQSAKVLGQRISGEEEGGSPEIYHDCSWGFNNVDHAVLSLLMQVAKEEYPKKNLK